MTSASTVSRVAPGTSEWADDAGPAAVVRAVVAAAAAADGLDAARRGGPARAAAPRARRVGAVARRRRTGSRGCTTGRSTWWSRRPRAAGARRARWPRRPSRPSGGLTAWSHGNHPAAAALAPRFGLRPGARPVGDAAVPVRPAPLAGVAADRAVDVRPFRVGADEDAFLAVNAAAFAHHPEQGGMTRADLDERVAEPWFDPAGLLPRLARRRSCSASTGPRCTRRARRRFGEVYVVGVAPTAQGGGLGRLLTLTGLHHLAARGLARGDAVRRVGQRPGGRGLRAARVHPRRGGHPRDVRARLTSAHPACSAALSLAAISATAARLDRPTPTTLKKPWISPG